MTFTLPSPTRPPAERPLTAGVGQGTIRRVERPAVAALARPGALEKALVILTIFVMIHETPQDWFMTRADLVEEQSNPVAVIIGAALMGLGIARIMGCIDHLIGLIKTDVAVFAFVGITMASTFWSANAAETLEKSFIFALVTFYAAYLVLRFSLHEILKLLAFQFCISGLLNLLFVVALPVYGVGNGVEFDGVFGQKNALGFFAALALPILVVAGRAWIRWRFAFYLGALLWLGLLLGSRSKTMLLAAMIPTMLLVVYHTFRSRHTLRGAVFVSLVGSSVFTIFFATANIALLAGWLNKDVTLTGRVPMWQQLLPIAFERPFTGYGYKATFAGYYSPVHELWIQSRWNPTHAHNAALQIVLEIGIFGLIAFLFCFVRAISRAIKIVAMVPGAVGLWPLSFFTSTLLVSITESGMAATNIGWLLFMIAVLSVAGHLEIRSRMGLSNDLKDAVATNRAVRRGFGP